MTSFRDKSSAFALRAALFAAMVAPSASATAGVLAKSTAAFESSLGINAHLSVATLVGPTSPYYNPTTVVGELQYLGIHHVRDDIRPNTSGNVSAAIINDYSVIGSAGNTIMPMFAPYHFSNPSVALAALAPVARYIDAIEGSNEIDVTPPSFENYTGASAATAYQRVLWTAKGGNSAFANAQVVYYTYGNFQTNPVTGANTAGLNTIGNVHAYPPNGKPPLATLTAAYTIEEPYKRPVWMTETGYPTGLPSTIQSIPQSAQASYILDELFDNANLSYARTYLYELSDEANNTSNKEDCFGLFNYNGTEKPSAVAVHNLLQILSSTGTGAMDGLDFTIIQNVAIPSNDANTFHILMQKPGGPFELVVWAEPELVNPPPTGGLIAAIPHPVTITFPTAHKTISVYDPLVGTTATNTYSNSSSVSISTTDHPLIIEISQD